jgi:hypothetical protein
MQVILYSCDMFMNLIGNVTACFVKCNEAIGHYNCANRVYLK